MTTRRDPPTLAPRDLTIPAPGSTTARDVLSRAIRRLLGDLRRAPLQHASARARADFSVFARVAGALARSDPGALASVVRRPTVGVLIRCLRSAPGNGLHVDALLRELAATACLELAAVGALPGVVELRAPPRRVVSLAARCVVDVPDGARALRIRDGWVSIDGDERPLREDAARFVALTSSPGGPVLALVDNNPISDFEAHPDKQGNALDLGGRSRDEWRASLEAALAHIGRFMPALRGEIELIVHQIIPVGYDAHAHLSASYQEDIGTLYMTLHPRLMTMVEAVIHEFSHNKINALFELDAVLHNAFHPLYKSPVRPDPRPLHGVLLAVHAFQPVARLYERMIEERAPGSDHPDFRRRFQTIVRGNHEGASVLLEHGQPTEAGAAVLDEIRRWDEHFAIYDDA
ncbi:MAG: hypothetical protein H6713_32525 [Myxococcales bacterium]|nr:hypothetical protein [Myxococcales bacterium]